MQVGDKVEFQFFNTPEGVFYGPIHKGEIIAMRAQSKPFQVKYRIEETTIDSDIWLHRKEIKRVIN
jgi:hypothetical protein